MANYTAITPRAMSPCRNATIRMAKRYPVWYPISISMRRMSTRDANALQRVSTQRSALGAVQNRLEHAIRNLDNVVENTTGAESVIRDTDMAMEMVKYSA